MKPKELAISELAEQIIKFSSSLRALVRAKLKEENLDITTEMLQVLRCLYDNDGINQQEIANAVVKDKASLTYLIDNLTKRKLVKRIEDENDRRNKLIFLTKEGKELRSKTILWLKEIYSLAATDINVSELREASTVFDKIIDNINGKN